MKIIVYCSPFMYHNHVGAFERDYEKDISACARLIFPEAHSGSEATRNMIDQLVSDLKVGYIDTLYVVTRYETAPSHLNMLVVEGQVNRADYEIRLFRDENSTKYTVHHIAENDMIDGNWPFGVLF